MAWLIESKDLEAQIEGVYTVEQLEFSLKNGKLCARELNSTNGLMVNEKLIPSDKTARLEDGDVVQLGKLRFTIRSSALFFERNLAFKVAGVLTFALLAGLILSDPSLRNAHAAIIAKVLGLLAVGTCMSVAAGKFLVDRKLWSLRGFAIFLMFMLLAATVADEAAFKVSDSTLRLTEALLSARLEYVCSVKFDAGACIELVQACPKCSRIMSYKTRLEVAANIKEVENEVIALAKMQEQQRRKPSAIIGSHF